MNAVHSHYMHNKAEIITQFRAQLQEEYDSLNRGRSSDTDTERIQKRLEELKNQLATFQEVREPAENIGVGSLVAYEEIGKKFFCLIIPGALGEIVENDAGKIACVSPDSHIAEALKGKKIGDEVVVAAGKRERRLKIISIL